MNIKILVPVNTSATTEKTIEAIIREKNRLSAPIVLLHVVSLDRLSYRMIPEFQVEMIRQHAEKSGRQVLQQIADRLRSAGFEVEERLETGAPREIIPRVANEENFFLLIIGRRGQGEIREVLFSSVANHVVHGVKCPVLLI